MIVQGLENELSYKKNENAKEISDRLADQCIHWFSEMADALHRVILGNGAPWRFEQQNDHERRTSIKELYVLTQSTGLVLEGITAISRASDGCVLSSGELLPCHYIVG